MCVFLPFSFHEQRYIPGIPFLGVQGTLSIFNIFLYRYNLCKLVSKARGLSCFCITVSSELKYPLLEGGGKEEEGGCKIQEALRLSS